MLDDELIADLAARADPNARGCGYRIAWLGDRYDVTLHVGHESVRYETAPRSRAGDAEIDALDPIAEVKRVRLAAAEEDLGR